MQESLTRQLSGLTQPNIKYYDSYAYSESIATDHARSKLGDATKETLKTYGNENGGWNGDFAVLPSGTLSWFGRGGNYGDSASAGTYLFYQRNGSARTCDGFRSIITAQ